jgi:hypothetical protein
MVLNDRFWEDQTSYLIYEYPAFMTTFAAFFGGRKRVGMVMLS